MARKIVMNFALDRELLEDLQRMSAMQQQSMSMIVRAALRSHLQAHKLPARNGAGS